MYLLRIVAASETMTHYDSLGESVELLALLHPLLLPGYWNKDNKDDSKAFPRFHCSTIVATWASNPARQGIARRAGAMFMAKLESWRKRNVRSPIHGDAGKKRMNLASAPREWLTVHSNSCTMLSISINAIMINDDYMI